MTEEEAKTKKCHVSMAPMYVQNMELGYALSASVEPRPCIGSACMAWRQVYAMGEVRGRTVRLADPPGAEIHGYCGLAGNP